MIAEVIRRLCAMSLLFGTALSIAPEGSVKRIMNIVCSVILICAVIQPLQETDISEYALEIAKARELEAEFLENGQELSDRLNRLVIENECEAYIKDKAVGMGMEIDVQVLAKWSVEGLWVPYEVKLDCSKNAELSELIKVELGIPEERQQWQD